MNIETVAKLELTPKTILIVNGKEGQMITDADIATLRQELKEHCGFDVPVFANCTVGVLQPIG